MRGTVIQKKVDILSTCPLFDGMERWSIKAFLNTEGCSVRGYPEGRELPSDRGMMIMLSGSVVIEKLTSDGRYLRMQEVGPPQPINVSALSKASPGRLSRMVTPAGCVVVELSRPFITKALTHGGQFSVNLVEFLLDRVVYLNKKISVLSGYTATARVTMYLEEYAVTKDGERQVTLPCSLSEFAEVLCVGRASLYRTLDAMEQQGRISRKGRTIRLLKQLEKE